MEKFGWNFFVNGGGGQGSLDGCIEMLFDHSHSGLEKTCSMQDVKDFCLENGFFACSDSVIYPAFEDGVTSIDYQKIKEDILND